ncbi:pterocarpan synthase 1-like [Lolium perenne]|uniref:pterocarpan synthase 1-like n=1 Tax=Lolium perenne TaxID=4522 RepID=UPI003A98DBA7
MAVARGVFLLLSSSLLICGPASAADVDVTHLRFYVHEVEVGTNATVVNVASPHRNSSKFGDVNVFDNMVREGPDPTSRLIGRAQGLAVHASVDGRSGLVAINFVFSDYDGYSGSGLTTQGPMGESGAWEQSIVGGTGKLRFARGYMVSELVASTNTSIAVVFDSYFTLAA